MPSDKTYTIEYWIEITRFSKEQLENHVKQSLDKFLENINFDIQEKANYLILRIVSTEEIIDTCHDQLKFEREWSFRAKDELGNLLRAKAYPVLAEIELRLRSFISQAMIDVLGFDWWNSFISENIQKRVRDIEAKAGKNQVKFHHPIEFTFFDDLIVIVTTNFQAWSDSQAVTVTDLSELLSVCNSIEDVQREVNNRRKIVSFWDSVFSDYFDDKEAWIKLKENIEKSIIPIRNKVMHHRLMRRYELGKIEECRDEVKRVLSLAKTTLSDVELEEIQPSIKIIIDGLKPQLDPELLKKAMSGIDPEFIKKAMQPAIDSELLKKAMSGLGSELRKKAMSGIDPELLKKAMQPAIDSEFIKKAMQPAIDSELLKKAMQSAIDPELLKKTMQSMQSAIDLELLKRRMPEIELSTSQEKIDNDEDNMKAESETDEPDSGSNSQSNDEDDSNN
ncbi:hypothetical protein H6F78_09740 [Coleofasciculus sp. FACHB-64]|uniref:hypothetical protein n=1 Tax=Cyanophyceae TaxID=3028117 RepID=UPI001686B455|nr:MULTISPECIES: hypothetical protein [unclassified Coleofasciculus]MBD1838643.1 hypothetical protein [Coleofasciculus sp. FACHB-501]MBD2045878.1 hypothetical protein [Coleofasciculus sp. FACHB-64]MBD2086281.1 hypothetical protein [Coleofasciculus sp. FACHB-542]